MVAGALAKPDDVTGHAAHFGGYLAGRAKIETFMVMVLYFQRYGGCRERIYTVYIYIYIYK